MLPFEQAGEGSLGPCGRAASAPLWGVVVSWGPRGDRFRGKQQQEMPCGEGKALPPSSLESWLCSLPAALV